MLDYEYHMPIAEGIPITPAELLQFIWYNAHHSVILQMKRQTSTKISYSRNKYSQFDTACACAVLN